MKKVLYISYDGMTDPLGQSQVIPYLLGLAEYGYQFTILSFEKKDRYRKLEKKIRNLLDPAGIKWEPVWFTSRPPVLAKFYDIIRMRRAALRLQARKNFDLVHCRSYPSSENGLLLKRKFGIKFLFDMRGFWADEKKDGGGWKQNSFIFRRVYKHYKKKEKEFIRESDAIISLTEAGKKEMATWKDSIPFRSPDVIPCCADMDLFTVRTASQRSEARKILGLPEQGLVLSYLGSLGAWYMLEEMLSFFRELKNGFPEALFLIITHSPPSMIRERLTHYGLEEKDIRIVPAEREEVPVFAKAADISVSFIRPVYSKLSSSPTKLGELLSMGIPVIVNAGVGDVEEIVHDVKGGSVIKEFTLETFRAVVDQIPTLLALDAQRIRHNAEQYYSLKEGIRRYAAVYERLFNNTAAR